MLAPRRLRGQAGQQSRLAPRRTSPLCCSCSGGLDAGNVAEALRITRAPGVDVSSGVEARRATKDPDKIRAKHRRCPRGRAGTRRTDANREQRMTIQQPNSFAPVPTVRHFGLYGGRFVGA
jgi:hypothetical protein